MGVDSVYDVRVMAALGGLSTPIGLVWVGLLDRLQACRGLFWERVPGQCMRELFTREVVFDRRAGDGCDSVRGYY